MEGAADHENGDLGHEILNCEGSICSTCPLYELKSTYERRLCQDGSLIGGGQKIQFGSFGTTIWGFWSRMCSVYGFEAVSTAQTLWDKFS